MLSLTANDAPPNVANVQLPFHLQATVLAASKRKPQKVIGCH
jgi:hypothetical protein